MMKRFLLPSLILLLLASILWGPQLPHDLKLVRFRNEFSKLPHPISSSLVKSGSKVGLLFSNGDHCDYLAWQLRESLLSPDQLRAFYRNQHLALFSDSSVSLSFQEDIDSWSNELFDHALQGLARKPGAIYYIISAEREGDPPNFDPRCY